MAPTSPGLVATTLALAVAACGADPNRTLDSGAPPTDATSPARDVPPASDDAPPPTRCPGGRASSLTGTVFAPNAHDPLPGVYVYLTPDGQAFPPASNAVACQQCATPSLAMQLTQSGPTGGFALTGGTLDAGGTFTLVVESGGFRHVERHVAVGPCSQVALTAAQTSLPGATSGDDTIPHTVVAGFRGAARSGTDVNDHFTAILDAIGITGYDTVDPDRSGHASGALPDLAALLTDPAQLNQYQILAVPCGSLGNFTVAQHLTPAMVANLQAWLLAGGRLYASDLAYAVIDRSDQGAITFATGAASTYDPADVGLSTSSSATVTATVDDPGLRGWLQQVGVITGGGSTVPITDFRDPWGAIGSIPDAELTGRSGALPAGDVLVSGDVQWHVPGAGHHPLTVRVDVPNAAGAYCGRVVFTSYHVESQSSGRVTSLTAQERVLEYLFFQLSSCIEAPG